MATQYTAGLTTGQVLTAATMNSIGAAWESYTPVIKGGATTVTATIAYAKYAQINKIVFVRVEATVTSAGAANGIISVSLPLNPTGTPTTVTNIGTFFLLRPGTAFYQGAAIQSSNTVTGTANNSTDAMGANSPTLTLANNDKISFSVCYEIA
jgi:hypothetical protein